METSTLNGANGTRTHGIVPLSMKEIELVAGGKAANTPTSAWDRFVAWLDNWLSGGSSQGQPQQPVTVPSAEVLTALLEACRATGGTFEISGTYGSGSANLAVVRSDGVGATFRIVCSN